MTLDSTVAQAVYRARSLERALHDPGPWTMSWGPHEVPACRLISDDRILFLAHFPSHCYLMVPDPTLTLLCAGEEIGSREIVFPGDGEFAVEWSLHPDTLVSA